MRNGLRRIGAMGMAAVMAAAIAAPSSALALSHSDDANIPDEAQETGTYITGAATRAAMPALEILGLASVEESGQFIDTSDYFNWSQPKYMLAATSYNTVLSPYLANLATGETTVAVYDEDEGDYVDLVYDAAVYNASRTGGGNGPNAALSQITNASDPDYDATDMAVRALNPDVVLGNGGGADASAIAYSFSDYSGLASTMLTIASAADTIDAADTARTLRYGNASATAIATAYKQYVFGTMGYVQKALDGNIDGVSLAKKKVVLVTGVTGSSAGNYTYTLMTNYGATNGNNGTAAVNRYLETTTSTGLTGISLADNYADTLAGTGSTAKTVTADLSQIMNADLILVGGQQNSSSFTDITTALYNDGLLAKTYYVKDNGSAGAQYGVVMNSVENAQNVGRILGMLYPSIINQQSWMAYYYETFYHIDGNKLAGVMNSALDGVRNAAVTAISATNYSDALDELSEWNFSAAYNSSFQQSTVASTIATGYSYYQSLGNN